jgi:hypothetical protein
MKSRCSGSSTESSNQKYHESGVRVCDEWQEYAPFAAWARANGYRDVLSLGLIDAKGDFCPENCQWRANQLISHSKLSIKNKSGYKGVTRTRNGKRWQASISINKKSVYIGTYDDPVLAALAYDQKAFELHGDAAYFNFPRG